ncbi:MAG: V-type ATPase subunit [Thiotrichaceae bacterium]|nr:V-type ATPase subunit [Thiotrichaceae bacterium]
MNHFTRYAYLNARVAVLATRLLPESHLYELFHAKAGQSQSSTRNLDDWLKDDSLDFKLLEQAWFLKMLDDFRVLIRPLTAADRDLLLYWLRKNEIANLKTILRGKLAGLSADNIASQLLELGQLASLPLEQLLNTEDVSELLRHLENSPYGTIARQSRRAFEERHDLHALDSAIDRHYLLGLVAKLKTLESSSRKALLPLVSAWVDQFNLLWLLRYRFSYQLSSAETFYLLIPTSYHLNREVLLRLVELNSLEEVLAQLPEPLRGLLADTDSIFNVEQRLLENLKHVAEHTLRWENFSIAKALAYLFLRELEMWRVLAIVKGKRLKLPPSAIAAAAHLNMSVQ